jgi:hypothetical protein
MTVTSEIVNKDAYDELVESNALDMLKRHKADIVKLLSEQPSDFDSSVMKLLDREIMERFDQDVKYADAVAYLYFGDSEDVDASVAAGAKPKDVVKILGLEMFKADTVAKVSEWLDDIGDKFDEAVEEFEDDIDSDGDVTDSELKAAAETAFADVVG